MGDEGIGIHAIEQLRVLACHPEQSEGSTLLNSGDSSVDTLPQNDTQVDILDGGTGGMTIFHLFERYDRVILIDAADFGGRPGDIKRFELSQINLSTDSAQVSLHGTSLAGILELAKQLDKKMPEITIIAVQPKNIAPSFQLSDECQMAIPKIVELFRNFF
jgi:hydrogenase maturation protease